MERDAGVHLGFSFPLLVCVGITCTAWCGRRTGCTICLQPWEVNSGSSHKCDSFSSGLWLYMDSTGGSKMECGAGKLLATVFWDLQTKLLLKTKCTVIRCFLAVLLHVAWCGFTVVFSLNTTWDSALHAGIMKCQPELPETHQLRDYCLFRVIHFSVFFFIAHAKFSAFIET